MNNKCTHAASRISQLGLSGFPTCYFDGNYKKAVGAQNTIAMQKYWYTTSFITPTGNRAVADMDVDVSVQWLGNATMDITVTVTNNTTNPFSGMLRVYVTEILSSLGWYSGSAKYGHPLLDWAWTPSIIFVAAGDTYTQSTTWIGANHNNGSGVDYSTIQYDNTRVVAAIFQGNNAIECNGGTPDSLSADSDTLSVSGGTVNLDLYAGGDQAGRTYLILGSFAGSTPGLPLPGGLATLPVNWDNVTDLIINSVNGSTFVDFLSVLNGEGYADAQLVVSSLNANKIGKVLTLAYLLEGTPDWDFASNPVNIEFVP